MKLATKFSLVLLFLTVILVVSTGYAAFVNGRRGLAQSSLDRLTAVNNLKHDLFEQWLADDSRSLRELARRPLVKLYATQLNMAMVDTTLFVATRHLLEDEHLQPPIDLEKRFESLFLVRATDGQIMAATDPALVGKYREHETYFQAGQQGTFTGNFTYSVAQGKPVLFISTPVTDSQEKIVAVLVGQVDGHDISERIQQTSDVRSSMETYLVNSFNFFVTEPRLTEVELLRTAIHTEGVADCLAGNSGSAVYEDYRGMRVQGVYFWHAKRQLCIITEMDEMETLVSIQSLRRDLVEMGLVWGLFVMVVGFYFSRSLTRPLQQLIVGTEAIRQGDLAYRTGLTTEDEIGQLSRAFDQMTAELRMTTVSRDVLEIEVEERKQIEKDLVAAQTALSDKVAELDRSNTELQQFAYVASHDLQEPLRMVTSYMQLLERRYKGQLDEKADQFIYYAVDGANRMKRLIQDLLLFSRVGTQGNVLKPTDMAAVMTIALRNLQSVMKDHPVVITCDDLPTVLADSDQIVQLLQNLMSNALKFHGERPPQIHVGVVAQETGWLFSVQDNGIGIDPDYFDRIFIIFERLHHKDAYEGTGIGLAICRKIVERHNGRIWIESELGQGSTFFFTLPLIDQAMIAKELLL